jgi:hypothetical protein
MTDSVINDAVEQAKTVELTPEEAALKMQEQDAADRYELQFRGELKLYTTMLMAGIKGNNSVSQNGKKDVDNVKQCVRQAMLIMNYIDQLPLSFNKTE